ncbi:MAG TPA: hypothetical protein VHW23_23550 [Kofleriaceae bacterium]|jgi:hypothetical protein|nr:hypothetical protein [Kofleriaceae bacterium]
MSLEHHGAEAGSVGPPSDPDGSGPAQESPVLIDAWLLIQRDWSLRQREPRPHRIARLWRRVAAVAAWLRRLVSGAPRRAVQDSPR